MGWLYDSSELKTKQDHIDKLNEIKTWRELDGESFDFGSGEIPNEMLLGSEDSYYEMDIQSLEETIELWDAYEDTLIQAKSTLAISGYYLSEKEEDLVRKRMFGEITEEEFLKLALRYAKKGGLSERAR